MSKLSFVSKTVERINGSSMNQCLVRNNKMPSLQSADRCHYSTETELLHVRCLCHRRYGACYTTVPAWPQRGVWLCLSRYIAVSFCMHVWTQWTCSLLDTPGHHRSALSGIPLLCRRWTTLCQLPWHCSWCWGRRPPRLTGCAWTRRRPSWCIHHGRCRA